MKDASFVFNALSHSQMECFLNMKVVDIVNPTSRHFTPLVAVDVVSLSLVVLSLLWVNHGILNVSNVSAVIVNWLILDLLRIKEDLSVNVATMNSKVEQRNSVPNAGNVNEWVWSSSH
jgi:hypothetical protein